MVDFRPRSNGRGFSRDRRSNDRFGEEKRFGDRRSSSSEFRRGKNAGFGGPREMHEAECSKCGKQCKVPFKPSGGKPVYCTDCFRSNEGSDSRGSFAPRGQDSSSSVASGISQEQFQQLNVKLDKILLVLEQLEIDVDEDDEDSEEKD